jgi:general secretion pathway protein A
VAQYIEHRIRTASQGHVGTIFEEGAVQEIVRYSKGIPRVINVVCDRALLIGYVHDRRRVGIETVQTAIRELERGFRPAAPMADVPAVGAET